jgi:hypothetical protein
MPSFVSVIIRPFKEWFIGVRIALFVSIGAQLADVFSSLGFGPEFEEQNPFTRYPNTHGFWLAKGLEVKSAYLIMFAVLSLAAYFIFAPFGDRARRFAATAPWLYFAYGALMAAFNNTILHFFQFIY